MNIKVNRLKEILNKGKIAFGMSIYTGSPIITEILGYCGFDFAFIDTEHSPLLVNSHLEHLIRAAEITGMSTIVRVKHNEESMIRNAFEAGTQGVIVPQIKTMEDVKKAIEAAKFPPLGIRGAAADVRSTCYNVGSLKWEDYIKFTNENSMIIPLAEHKEFFENIDDILELNGISAINFGAMDLSMSLGSFSSPYQKNNSEPKIEEFFNRLIIKAKAKNIPVMSPVYPPTLKRAQELVDKGVQMLFFRTDITAFREYCQNLVNKVIDPLKNERC